MKGNKKVIAKLNDLLADELTAINQYMVHSEMCDNWGYQKLHKSIEKRAITEMKHAESIIGRILYLEGIPVVSDLKKISIGAKVEKQFEHDHAAEDGAIASYNNGVKLCREVGDNGTADFLQKILTDEEDHIDEIEMNQDQISQVGIQTYLVEQI